MKARTAAFLAYAQTLLADAQIMAEGGLPAHAARAAYLACFHIAQAVIFERDDRAPKTHQGVHS